MFSESWQLPNKIKAAVKHTFFDMNISGWLNAEALVLLFFFLLPAAGAKSAGKQTLLIVCTQCLLSV